MIIYCTERFETEFKKLIKQNAYRTLEEKIMESFFHCSDDQAQLGSKISGTKDKMVIKKRIAGRGGYRVYFYAYFFEQKLYLSYLYPKTGPAAKISLNSKFEALIINETVEAIEKNELLKVSIIEGRLHFIPNNETFT
jgi:hypothetical protein